MHKYKSRKVLNFILIANFVLIVALGTFIIISHNNDVSVVSPYVHNRIRDAFVSQHFGTDIKWSQNLGGSMDEEIVDAFISNNGQLHIFGNSNSDDFDFDFAGSFMAILGKDGNTLQFKTINKDMNIVSVITIDNEYLVLQDGGENSKIVIVSRVDTNGKVLANWSTTDTNYIYAENISLNDNTTDPSIIVIYSRHLGAIGSQLIALSLPNNLNTNTLPPTTIVDSPYGIQYLSSYCINSKLLIFANEGIPNVIHSTAIWATLGSSPQFVRFNGINGPGFDYQTLAISPIIDGFILAVKASSGSTNGVLHLLTIAYDAYNSSTFVHTSTFNTRIMGVDNVEIIPNSTSCYIFAHSGQGGQMFLLSNKSIPTLNKIYGFEKWKDISSIKSIEFSSNTFALAGTLEKGIGLIIISDHAIQSSQTFGGSKTSKENSPLILTKGESLMIVANTSSADIYIRDGDVIRNFGMQDIWIIGLSQLPQHNLKILNLDD
ncbi:MAG: hypothetical protein FWF56_06215 [Firmicutes bacterium]|nr:hypothetical protein [Bacillota bacterium]MCL1953382.1 hypothetical protein [Bacillota bacterium]